MMGNQIFLKKEDIEYVEGARVKRAVVESTFLPLLKDFYIYNREERVKNIQVFCPYCQNKMELTKIEENILHYECGIPFCRKKIRVNIFPMVL